jgi:hypothetical protein
MILQSRPTTFFDIFLQTWVARGGVNNENFLEFEEELQALLIGTGVSILGNYGALQYILTPAQWALLRSNILPGGGIRNMFEIPPHSDPLVIPADGSTQAIWNSYNAEIKERDRKTLIRTTLLELTSALHALFIETNLWGLAVATYAKGNGTPAERADEMPLAKWLRIREKLSQPSRKTIRVWQSAWAAPMSNFSAWIAETTKASRKLEMSGEDYTITQKFHFLEEALAQSVTTSAVLRQYKALYPSLDTQSFAALRDYVEQQEENIENTLTRQAVGYGAQQAVDQYGQRPPAWVPEASILCYTQTDMDTAVSAAHAAVSNRVYSQQEVDSILASHLGATRGTGKTSTSKPSSGACFCWLHGLTGHLGSDCNQLKKLQCSDRAANDTRGQRTVPVYIGQPGAITLAQAQEATSVNHFSQFPGNAFVQRK